MDKPLVFLSPEREVEYLQAEIEAMRARCLTCRDRLTSLKKDLNYGKPRHTEHRDIVRDDDRPDDG